MRKAAYTVEEVSKILRVSKSTVYTAIHHGQLPVVRIGHSFRVPIAGLDMALKGMQSQAVKIYEEEHDDSVTEDRHHGATTKSDQIGVRHMASFEEILNRPSSENKAPEAYPVGTYHCIIDGYPEAGKSSQKQTDYLRFKYKIIQPMQDVDAKAAAEQQMNGKTITEDYYIVDNAVWRLNEMLANLGIEGIGNSKSLREGISEAPGRQLLVKIKHETSPDGKRVFHRVASTAHV